MARIVHGLPSSWEPSVAVKGIPDFLWTATWSPCSRTIAVCRGSRSQIIEILDAVTLAQLTILEFPVGDWGCFGQLVFFPNGHLTWLGAKGGVITWDLQTGVVVNSISTEQGGASHHRSSFTPSVCGTMFGVLFHNSNGYTLCTYNALSGTHTYTHPVRGLISNNIWTCGEHLQFATIKAKSLTIWEVGFASTHPPTEVETHSIPYGFYSPNQFLFHPTLPRVVLKKGGSVCIWSTQDSKFLLDSTDLRCSDMSFSPDGHFFVCIKNASLGVHLEVVLWKESHTGYILHKRLTTNLSVLYSLISPDGGSIIAFGFNEIQLWHTTDSSTLLPTSNLNPNHFIVEFSSDQVLVAIVRLEDKIVTVLDVKSGVPRLIIDTGMGVYGLGITGSSIVVVGDGKIVTWNIPTGDHIRNLRVDVTNSVQTATFNRRQFNNDKGMPAVLVSPNLHHIVVKDRRLGRDGQRGENSYTLYLYDIPTGQHLSSVPVGEDDTPWFTLDGSEVCCWGNGIINRWKITEGSESNITKLEHLGSTEGQPDRCPWQSSLGYQLVDDQWIFSPSGKRLFWLPPHLKTYRSVWVSTDPWQWRASQWRLRRKTWNGQFFILSHHELSEVMILELE